MRKITRTYRFDADVIEHASKNPQITSFAEWCSEAYRQQFMQISKLADELKHKIQEVEALKQTIKKLKQQQQKETLPQEEIEFLKQAPGRIERSTFEGVYKFYINNFGRDVSRRQFKILIDKYQNVTK